MRDELKVWVAKLGLGKSVRFTGFLSQNKLYQLYISSHIFFHPSELMADSNQEGIPNSMLEAMSSGLPVVATYHGGIPEAVENGRTGLLVPEKDPRALCEALRQLAESERNVGKHGTGRLGIHHRELRAARADPSSGAAVSEGARRPRADAAGSA